MHYFCLYIRGESILNKRYLLYGYGITNKAVKKFFDLHNVKYLIYLDDENDPLPFEKIFNQIDYVIKSPGIKFDTLFLKKCYELKIKVISDLELLYLLYKEYEYIIITGSNGKTTTSHLTYQMLNHLSLFKNGLGGNIGIPLFSLLLDKRVHRGMVIEASSFMLHNTYKLKPKIYVLTNLIPHHLDYHKNVDYYYFDKTKIIDNLDEKDYLIYNYDDKMVSSLVRKFQVPFKISFSYNNEFASCYIKNRYIYYQGEKIVALKEINKPQLPIVYDMMVAIIIAKIYHIPHKHIQHVLKNFKGLDFRFQTVYEDDKLVIINDSKATSPEASFYALRSVAENYQSFYKTLILGGRMIDDNYKHLNDEINNMDEVYLYGTSRFMLLNKIHHNKIFYFATIEEVIEQITIKSKHLILFSPSCVSYDQFTSYIQRGKRFNELISKFINDKKTIQK